MTDCGCHSHNGFQLSPEGLAPPGAHEVVDSGPSAAQVDRVGSVSGLVEVEELWVDELLEEQYRRFHGS